MSKLILKISTFLLILAIAGYIIIRLGNIIAAKEFGPNTEHQIRKSFSYASQTEATCWFLGNSRIYRGIDPEVINDANCFNFAHDNDSYNQIYYKLKYLEAQNRTIDTLILGIDYFQFGLFADTRNYVYDSLLGRDYSRDYSAYNIIELFNNLKRRLINNQSAFHSGIISYCMNGFIHPSNLPSLSDYGQYRYNAEAKLDDFVSRDAIVLDIQKNYFEKILDYCRNEDIDLYVLMPPIRDNELSNYTNEEMSSIRDMVNNMLTTYGFNDHYIDYSNHPVFKDYTKYTDITHLKPEAAKEFTTLFWKDFKHSI